MLRIAALTCLTLVVHSHASADDVVVDNVTDLVDAVRDQPPGSTITIEAGTYRLTESLRPKSGMKLRGAGMDQTILTHHPDWKPVTDSLPDPEVRLQGLDSEAYLIRIEDSAADVTLTQFTLRGPQLHGAVFCKGCDSLQLNHLRVQDFLWSGVRTYGMRNSRISDCEFIDAGGKWKRGGVPGTDGGISGGAIFTVWTTDSEFANNRIWRTDSQPARAHFGIKGRGGKQIHIHHNTIDVNFSIEFPFEGADRFEVDHNVLRGVVSIPKYAGGKVPESGTTFDIHHNYFTTSYAIEFVRNGVSIHHNLFDFDRQQDVGNLISGFGRAPAPGPAEFHNNLVSNPGRGVIWINEPYDNLTIRNNHIIARTTSTPRTEGLFGLNGNSDFSTIKIVDNIIECQGTPRPLVRNDASYGATFRNNRLSNITDQERLDNLSTDEKAGLQEPLRFECGAHRELSVDGWTSRLGQSTPAKQNLTVTSLGKLDRKLSRDDEQDGTVQKWMAVQEVLGRASERVVVKQLGGSLGGNTSIRNSSPLVWKEKGYFRRARDLGQVFTAPEEFTLDSIVLRTGNDTLAFLPGAAGAEVFVQFFEVTGEPKIDDNETPPGTEATHGFSTNHRCDDTVAGVGYKSMAVISGGRLPDLTAEGDGKLTYLRFHFGDRNLVFEAGRRYAFMVGFETAASQRNFTLSNRNMAAHPGAAEMNGVGDNYGGGWGLRREGSGANPPLKVPGLSPPSEPAVLNRLKNESAFPSGAARYSIPPTCEGHPDVDTYRDLEFYLIRR